MRGRKLQRELKLVDPDLRQLFCAVRTMNTFVCELCHDEELNSHPQLGSAWNLDWYLAMAALARKTGWSTVPPPDRRADWFFREFQVVGPRCGRR